MDDIFKLYVKAAGRYKLKKLSSNRQLLQELSFKNLITNNGLNVMQTIGTLHSDTAGAANQSLLVNVCKVGNGTTPPQFTDTDLTSTVASTYARYPGSFGAFYPNEAVPFTRSRSCFEFPVGTAAGNISEIGVGNAINSLVSKARILNEQGQPTTITVLPDEILQAEFTLDYFWDFSDFEGSFTTTGSAGDTYEYVARPCYTDPSAFYMGYFWLPGGSQGRPSSPNGNIDNEAVNALFTGSLGNRLLRPSGTKINGSVSVLAYEQDSFERKYQISFSTSQGDGSYPCLAVSTGFGAYQFQFDKPIVKTSQQVLTIQYKQSWQRG